MDSDGSEIEERIQGERAIAAHRLLLRELPKLGLTPSRKSGFVRSIRLHDVHNRYVFSWIPNQHHLLFYVRKPAMKAAPQLRASAMKALPRIKINPSEEITSRIEGREDAQRVLDWLKSTLPLPN